MTPYEIDPIEPNGAPGGVVFRAYTLLVGRFLVEDRVTPHDDPSEHALATADTASRLAPGQALVLVAFDGDSGKPVTLTYDDGTTIGLTDDRAQPRGESFTVHLGEDALPNMLAVIDAVGEDIGAFIARRVSTIWDARAPGSEGLRFRIVVEVEGEP